MRTVLAVVLMFVAGSSILAVTVSKDRNYPHFFKHRTKLREIRGFKPEYISTAIGFGKRDGAADFTERERDLLALRNIPRVVSADTLLRMMQMNPALADKLKRLSMEIDQGIEGESITEPTRPERTFALF
ncbi:hypothetical protein PUN28_004331 [Cardiocondyla obscurior]|uniref:Allatotropin n=1 Tax=Cardiocondyla obscurior TaxID=286306 RepID=A0AAW2GBX6_9HYME